MYHSRCIYPKQLCIPLLLMTLDWPGIRCLLDVSIQQKLLVGSVHTQVHDVIPANGAVIDDDIPSPKGNSVPLGDGQSHSHDGFQSHGNTFLTSNFFFSLLDSLATVLPLDEPAAAESFISTSAMMSRRMYVFKDGG